MTGPYVRGGECKDSPAGALPPVAFKGQRQTDMPPSSYSHSVTPAACCTTFGSYPYRGYGNLIKQSIFFFYIEKDVQELEVLKIVMEAKVTLKIKFNSEDILKLVKCEI